MTTKEAILKAMQELPDDASYAAAIERLYFLESVEKGIEQIKAGKTISNEEVMKRIEKWLS